MAHASLHHLRLIAGLVICLGLALSSPARAAEPRPLIFGVFPNVTARQAIEIYRPLADALEKALHRRVLIYTARDFRTFVERTREGEYDILVTAPHLAWLARQDAGYRPLLKYTQQVRGMLVVKNDSPYQSLPALRGRTIATADAHAVIVLAMQAELTAHGLKPGIDYKTSDSGTHMNAAMQVVNNRADAAMLGLHPYKLLPEEVRAQLRTLAMSPPLSSIMYLSHPRLRDSEAHTLVRALRDFAATPAGEAFMKRGGYGAFTAVDGSELRAFRPYALQVRDMLKAAD